MSTVLLAIGLVIILAVVMTVLEPGQKPGKRCQSCPEFKRCGGGKPRCPRRSGSI